MPSCNARYEHAVQHAQKRRQTAERGVTLMRTSVALMLCLLSATATAANLNAADLNRDGALDGSDLDVMRAAFYKHDARADLNGDGIVNFADLAMLKAAMTGTSAAPLTSPSVYLQPVTQNVGPSKTVTVELWMDFSTDPTLGGGTDFAFDPTRL